jgi:hypothetical protein
MIPPFEQIEQRPLWKTTDEVDIDPSVDLPNGSGVYGFQNKRYRRPEQLAPPEEDSGGFLFIPARAPEALIDNLVEIAHMASNEHVAQTKFGLQVIDAPDGVQKELGYMRKIVIADRFALHFLYRSIDKHEYDNYPDQPCDVAECVKAFMQSEREKYGASFGNPGLAGKFGGEGYYAQEALGFGFAIENSYHKVISVWSRGWLCTK